MEKLDESAVSGGIVYHKNPQISFLPNMDPYLIGYKDRERFIDEKHYFYCYDRSGNVTSLIILNGRIIGVWDIMEKPSPTIINIIFEKKHNKFDNLIAAEAEKMGLSIFNKKAEIKKCKKMEPLTNRTAGNFMTPLKMCEF